MKKHILLIGGGGHAKGIIDSLRDSQEFKVLGILDVKERKGEQINGIEIIGCDEELPYYYSQGIKYVFVAMGSVGSPVKRMNLYHQAKRLGYIIPNIIDSTAIISTDVRMEEGNYVGKGAIINVGTQIKSNCIINTGAIIDHDCTICDFVHIAPGATLCGGVTVGKATHIGANTTIIQYKQIGSNSLVGAGSVVVTDIGSNVKAYGNPCREVSTIG